MLCMRGSHGGAADNQLSKLIPGLENMGGFRKRRRKGSDDWAFVVLYTTKKD